VFVEVKRSKESQEMIQAQDGASRIRISSRAFTSDNCSKRGCVFHESPTLRNLDNRYLNYYQAYIISIDI
jgi:hypothetical protein